MSAPVPSIRIPCVIRKSGESQLQIDNFKWHLPLIYTHCLETIWNFLEKIHFNTLHHIYKMFQNCWRKNFLNTQNPGASGFFSPSGAPYQGYALDPLETFSGPQTPRRLSSPLTQNPRSAPDCHIFNWNIVESGIKDHNNNLSPTKMYLYTYCNYHTKMIMNAG